MISIIRKGGKKAENAKKEKALRLADFFRNKNEIERGQPAG